MARVRRIKKAYKIYGTDEGNVLLKLFYTYYTVTDTLEKYDRGKTQSEYRTAFTHYVRQKYGDEICDEYWSFYRSNKNNKKLIKVLGKKKKDYLIQDMVELALEIERRNQKDQIERRAKIIKKEEKKDRQKEIAENEPERDIESGLAEHSEVIDSKTGEIIGTARLIDGRWCFIPCDKKEPMMQEYNPYTSPGRIFDKLPARGIDYLTPAPVGKGYKITLRRYSDDSVFVVHHWAKSRDEAMRIANGHSFDSAGIINVEEE